MFRVGQKVVCVNDLFEAYVRRRGVVFPQQDAVYTVTRILRHPWYGPMLYLDEIRNPKVFLDEATGARCEPAWPAFRFRPIVERKTDISIFEEILRRESAPSPLAEA